MSPPAVDSTKDVEKKSTQRRINKPLIEKRRRARINDSLSQLKSIVLEANDTKNPRPSKLEKADILEMTVEFVKKMLPQSGDRSVPQTDNHSDYRAGYAECLAEISRFLETTRVVNNDLKKDIVSHVTSKLPETSETSDTTSHSIKAEPVRILPVAAHPTVSDNENEAGAIDLRMSNKKPLCVMADQDGTVPQVPDISELPVLPNNSSISSNKNNNQSSVINQNLPVGVLCGNQVMLLLQLPSVLTSGPCLTQGAVFGSPIKASQTAFNILQSDQTKVLQPTDVFGSHERTVDDRVQFITVPQGAIGQKNSDHSKSTNENPCDICPQQGEEPEVTNADSEHCCDAQEVQMSCVSGAAQSDHWRPW